MKPIKTHWATDPQLVMKCTLVFQSDLSEL